MKGSWNVEKKVFAAAYVSAAFELEISLFVLQPKGDFFEFLWTLFCPPLALIILLNISATRPHRLHQTLLAFRPPFFDPDT